MHIIFLTLIFISIFKNDSCSLLSRLKNRYEYVSQENLFSEDLYDFEFTNDKTTMKSTSINSLTEIVPASEELYHTSQGSIFLNTRETYRKGTDTLPDFYNNDGIAPVPAEPFFLSRPVIEFSSSKSRKTWPIYFPRKTLPRRLETGKSATTKTNVTLKNVERKSPHHGITLITSPPNNPTPSTSSSIMSTPTPSSTWTPLSALRNFTITSNTWTTATTPITTVKNKNITISYCYRCGLNESGIPSAYCYNIFEGGDISHGRRKNSFKIKCVRNERVREDKKIAYGPLYRKGCFKRFLDVGIEYNERGCRTIVPTRGKSYASERFASMEYLLKHVNDGCVFSPHTSITPFSRTISLFARYHVCVCSQKYCNRADSIKQNLNESFILIIYAVINHFFIKFLLL